MSQESDQASCPGTPAESEDQRPEVETEPVQAGQAGLLLFVCTGNTCRSPMAAALFNHFYAGGKYHAESAGLAAVEGEPASTEAVLVMQRLYGLDLSTHRSRSIFGVLTEQNADLILTMTRSQQRLLQQLIPELADRVLTLSEAAGLPAEDVIDPFGQKEDAYEQTAFELAELVFRLASRLDENNGSGQKTEA